MYTSIFYPKKEVSLERAMIFVNLSKKTVILCFSTDLLRFQRLGLYDEDVNLQKLTSKWPLLSSFSGFSTEAMLIQNGNLTPGYPRLQTHIMTNISNLFLPLFLSEMYLSILIATKCHEEMPIKASPKYLVATK